MTITRRLFAGGIAAAAGASALAPSASATPARGAVERFPWCEPIGRDQVGVFAPDTAYRGDGQYLLDDGRLVRLWLADGLQMNDLPGGAKGYLDGYVSVDRAEIERRIRGRLIYVLREDDGRWR